MKMENNNLNKMTENIRKAFRLLYQYQHCMQSLVEYAKSKYGFEDKTVGYKRFSNPIRRTRYYNNDNYIYDANLEISGLWAWDYLYSYEFEYFMGLKKIKKEVNVSCVDKTASMSIIQVSDTGYYLKENADATNIETFETVEKSKSILIFVCEITDEKTNSNWDSLGFLNDKIHILSSSEEDSIWEQYGDNPELGFFAKRYDIEDFCNQLSTDSKLKDFSDLFYNKTKVRLLQNIDNTKE